MADFEEFRFVIPAYTPETMPLDRLIEYLQQIGAVMGDPTQMHLVDMETSSTVPKFLVPRRAALEAQERTERVARGDGTKDQQRAYDRLRRMVRRDAPGSSRPAILRSERRVLLEIPAAPEEEGVLSGVRQATELDGLLVSIGGVGEAVSLRLQALGGEVVSGITTNRATAKEMAKSLYEPIRLTGTGVWGRGDEGAWVLDRMHVQSFAPLEGWSAAELLAELRLVELTWPSNSLELLKREREGAF